MSKRQLTFSEHTKAYYDVPTGCLILQNTDFYGNDLVRKVVETQQACADFCLSTQDGHFWTWEPKSKHCFVKSSSSGRRNHAVAVSGNRKCGSSIQGGENVFWNQQEVEASTLTSFSSIIRYHKRLNLSHTPRIKPLNKTKENFTPFPLKKCI